MVSISQLQEVPPKKMVLLVGSPGVGKTAFCEQAILQNLALGRPIIYVTTESGSSEARQALRERGLGKIEPGLLNFVDAYSETVGISLANRHDTVPADCANLSSISIAISKLEEQIRKKDILLIFNSLVSPYLLAGPEIIRFIRLTLSKFVAEGNSILASMDKGCGKQEEIGAMMSIANGVIELDQEEERKILNVVKHPKVKPKKIEVPIDKTWEKRAWDVKTWDREMYKRSFEAEQKGSLNKEFGALAVNVFWPSIMRWNSLLWDPQKFTTIMYDFLIQFGASFREIISMIPWHMKLLYKISMPKSFSKVKEMKKLMRFIQQMMQRRGLCIMEYMDKISKTDKHYIRVYESYECSGFENVGTTTSLILAPILAGMCQGLEKERREWNAVETKCIGLGDPYCEFKLVPGEIDELKNSLQKDTSALERIHDRLMQRITGFLLHEKPLVERAKLGCNLAYSPETSFPFMAERFQMAFRMGGARAGKKIGECLMHSRLTGDAAVKRMISLLKYAKVGEITVDKTIKIRENIESNWIPLFYTIKWEEPCCFFTTGFLNGFFSTVKNQHVKETKCIAMGDPYCEWEFR
jgi:predicted hydrocarbon binding protein/KaiC/GvpD/RAD55 family RecA-like ATPase